MLQTLDVALGLSFIFFLFSVLVSTLSEMILSWSNARGKMLWKALSHMLPQSAHGKDAAPLSDLVQHPLITSMYRHTSSEDAEKKHFPSYLTSSQFSQVLMDVLETKGTQVAASQPQNKPETRWEQVRTGISQLGAASSGPLQALSRDAERNLLPGQEPSSVFQFLVGQWFDAMMDRSTGWYKRLTQLWNFVLGIGLAIACNLNVIAITRALSTNDKLREALVQKAEAAVKELNTAPVPTPPAAATPATSASGSMNTQAQYGEAEFKETMDEISAAGFPVGWNTATANAWRKHPFSSFFESLLGWFMAGAAATLGAQFWFDLMKKIVNLRGTGARPDPGQNAPQGEAGMTGPIPPAGLIITGTESQQG